MFCIDCFRELKLAFEGIFPKDNPKNTRFSINFFTSIGLGGLTLVFLNSYVLIYLIYTIGCKFYFINF